METTIIYQALEYNSYIALLFLLLFFFFGALENKTNKKIYLQFGILFGVALVLITLNLLYLLIELTFAL